MSIQIRLYSLAFASALGISALAGSASAATVACSAAVAGKLTANVGCEVSDTANQDFLNSDPITVNAEKFFGISDWMFEFKIEDPKEQSGKFSILGGLWDKYESIMAIFKSGKGTYLTGYLLKPGDTMFTYSSPFLNKDPKKDPKDISHISFYGVKAVTPPPPPPPSEVPLPAAGWLMIAGLGSLAAMRRRKRA